METRVEFTGLLEMQTETMKCFQGLETCSVFVLDKNLQSMKVREGYVKRNVKQIFTSLMWFLAGF